MDKLLHLKFWYWLGTIGTAVAGGIVMGLFAETTAESAWGEPAPEIAVTYERLNGYKILGIAGIMVAIGLIAKGRDFAKLAASVGGIMLLVFVGHASYGDVRGYVVLGRIPSPNDYLRTHLGQRHPGITAATLR